MQAILIKIYKPAAEKLVLGNPYDYVQRVLSTFGFYQESETLYTCKSATPVDAVLAVQTLFQEQAFLRQCTEDIRLLRIEDDSDLMPAVNAVFQGRSIYSSRSDKDEETFSEKPQTQVA